MKIVLLTQYYKPEIGAPQNRLSEMAKGLKELGHEISVVTGMPNYPTGSIFNSYRRKFSYKEDLEGISIRRYWLYSSTSKHALPRIINMLSFSLTSLCSIFSLRKNKPDFIIVESPPLTLGLTAYLLCRLTKARLIANISDLWPRSAVELGAISEHSLAYKVMAWMEHFIYSHSVFCMGQSEEIVNYLSTHCAKYTYLFRNGVNPDRFKDVKKEQRSNRLCIVYAGLLGYAQGVMDVCKNINFAELGAEFHIYGSGGEAKAIADFTRIHKESGIIYHGKVSSEDIPQVLVNADVSLVPLVSHIYGAVPSKIYESMAAGLPIIFSGDGEGCKIVQKEQIGWTTTPRDYNHIKYIIKQICNNPALMESKREKCRECAQQKYNRPKQIKDLHNYMITFKTSIT